LFIFLANARSEALYLQHLESSTPEIGAGSDRNLFVTTDVPAKSTITMAIAENALNQLGLALALLGRPELASSRPDSSREEPPPIPSAEVEYTVDHSAWSRALLTGNSWSRSRAARRPVA
jgi:hypothetical protein